jgi:hypothetical protein
VSAYGQYNVWGISGASSDQPILTRAAYSHSRDEPVRMPAGGSRPPGTALASLGPDAAGGTAFGVPSHGGQEMTRESTLAHTGRATSQSQSQSLLQRLHYRV